MSHSTRAEELSPRLKFFDEATLAFVEKANIVRIRLNKRRDIIYARLIGVGSPEYGPRLEDYGPSLEEYIDRNDYSEKARIFVQKLLEGKTFEVWTRKYGPLDSKRRLLAYLKAPDDKGETIDVNASVIKNGMGFVARDYVHVTYARYRRLEYWARKSQLGIWKGLERKISSSAPR
jgi:endonuclease YncB( thermonuclease family)